MTELEPGISLDKVRGVIRDGPGDDPVTRVAE